MISYASRDIKDKIRKPTELPERRPTLRSSIKHRLVPPRFDFCIPQAAPVHVLPRGFVGRSLIICGVLSCNRLNAGSRHRGGVWLLSCRLASGCKQVLALSKCFGGALWPDFGWPVRCPVIVMCPGLTQCKHNCNSVTCPEPGAFYCRLKSLFIPFAAAGHGLNVTVARWWVLYGSCVPVNHLQGLIHGWKPLQGLNIPYMGRICLQVVNLSPISAGKRKGSLTLLCNMI